MIPMLAAKRTGLDQLDQCQRGHVHQVSSYRRSQSNSSITAASQRATCRISSSLGAAIGSRPVVQRCMQLGVVGFEMEHQGDTGQVEPGVEQFADTPQPVEVVAAVTPGAAAGAGWFDQPMALVGAQVLATRAHEFGGH